MKTLIFLRHAKSSWADLGVADKMRTLNDRGRRDAPVMAGELSKIYPKIDAIISSSSQRTRETTQFFIQRYGQDIATVSYHDTLYHGIADDYQNQLYDLDEALDTVLLVGHNPGITQIANDCIHQEYLSQVPTCGIVVLQAASNTWTEVDLRRCKRGLHIYPKMYV